MSTALLLAAQIALAPCAIEGVRGSVGCGARGAHSAWPFTVRRILSGFSSRRASGRRSAGKS